MKQKDDGMTTLDIRDMNDVVVVSFKHAQLVDLACHGQDRQEFVKGSPSLPQASSLSQLCPRTWLDTPTTGPSAKTDAASR
jgi:hypothetical protein